MSTQEFPIYIKRSDFIVAHRRALLHLGFKPVSEFPAYFVSRQGVVLSTNSKCFPVTELSPGVKPSGYEFVGLRDDTRCAYKMVHRLVAEAFIPNPDGLPEVNHKDGNKRNNHVRNLEWITRSGNIQHALAAGLVKRGLEHPASKLTAEQVAEIRVADGAYRDIGARYGVCAETVSRIKNSKGPYRHLTGPTLIRPRMVGRRRDASGRLL